jgi:hypothetical protein
MIQEGFFSFPVRSLKTSTFYALQMGTTRRGHRRRPDHGCGRMERREGPGHGRVLRRAQAGVEAASLEAANGTQVAVLNADIALPLSKVRSEERVMTKHFLNDFRDETKQNGDFKLNA